MSNNEQAIMVNMEADLMNDKSGAYKKELVQKLIDYKVNLQKRMDSGLTPDEFKPLSGLKGSIDAAIAIIEKYWSSKH